MLYNIIKYIALNILYMKNNALNILYMKNNALNILCMKNKVTYIGPFSSISSNESLTAHVLSTLQDSAGADARWNLISTCDCSHSFITMVSSVIEGWKRIFWFGLDKA